jgi:hypothetical protein
LGKRKLDAKLARGSEHPAHKEGTLVYRIGDKSPFCKYKGFGLGQLDVKTGNRQKTSLIAVNAVSWASSCSAPSKVSVFMLDFFVTMPSICWSSGLKSFTFYTIHTSRNEGLERVSMDERVSMKKGRCLRPVTTGG